MGNNDDWDLQAVVRSCAAAATSSFCNNSTDFNIIHHLCNFQSRPDDNENNNSFCFQDLLEPTILTTKNNTSSDAAFEELNQLCKPFFTESEKLTLSSISVLEQLQDLLPQRQQQQQQLHQRTDTKLIQTKRPLSLNGSTTCTLHAQSPRAKRRGYYKCSTSKGCLARKQVERNRSDPNMFIVTYTAEHNHPKPTHRNSLAGISRHKRANSNKPTSSSPVSSPATNSPAPENQESSRDEKEDIFEDDDDEFGVSDVGLDKMEPGDDFFEGLDELEIPAIGDGLPDKLPGTLQLTWLANNAATTAAGGG